MVHPRIGLSVVLLIALCGTFTVCKNATARTARDCNNCTNCCNTNTNTKTGDIHASCISSNMKVNELTKGIISVSQLATGDIIQGIRGPKKTSEWCKVNAVYLRVGSENSTTYNGFTDDHMIIDGDTVRAHGNKGEETVTQLYTLDTECDAALNAAGQAFTPLSTAFCPHELNWSEYLILIAAIRRVTSRTGYFWYLSDAFHDNSAARVAKWADMLPDMCIETLRCAREGECQKFEETVQEFVHEHLNKKYVVIVENVFPNLGGKANQDGTVSYMVCQKEKTSIILISTLSAIACLLIVVAVLAICLFRVVKKAKQVSPKKFNNQTA